MIEVICKEVPTANYNNFPPLEYGSTYNVTEDGTLYSDGAWRVHFTSRSILYHKKYFCSLDEWRELQLNKIIDV